MSVKSVTCPQCQSVLNVMANMAMVKCQSCGHVFSTAAAPEDAAPLTVPSKSRSVSNASESNAMQWVIVGVVLALAVGGLIALVTLIPSDDQGNESSTRQAEAKTSEEKMTEAVDTYLLSGEGLSDFRVVDLPESTRKKIHREMKQMIGSSVGRAGKVPKGGVAGQATMNMFGSIADREVQRMALVYNVSEDDIRQIIAEGEAKGW